MTRKTAAREERILAKPLVQSGVLKQPGETVRLRPDQIARLEAGGHFEPVKAKAAHIPMAPTAAKRARVSPP